MNMIFLEDDEIIRNSYSIYLNMYFKKIHELDDGEKALEVFEKESIDFILTDINMEKMNGLEFVKEIRKRDKDVPIVILSAYDNKEYLFEAITLGLVTYLVKPIKTSAFKNIINKVLIQLKNNYKIQLKNNYVWNTKENKLYLNKEEIILTRNELFLFKEFCTKNEIIFSLEDISELIYPCEEYNINKTRMIIKRLNKKLNYTDTLENIHNIGYKFTLLKYIQEY